MNERIVYLNCNVHIIYKIYIYIYDCCNLCIALTNQYRKILRQKFCVPMNDLSPSTTNLVYMDQQIQFISKNQFIFSMEYLFRLIYVCLYICISSCCFDSFDEPINIDPTCEYATMNSIELTFTFVVIDQSFYVSSNILQNFNKHKKKTEGSCLRVEGLSH